MNTKKIIKEVADNRLGSINDHDIIRKVSQYQFVSFDIFDTIIKRDVPTPSYVFEMVSRVIHDPYFMGKRIMAESSAREQKDSHEVTFEEIYNELYPDDPDKRKKVGELEKKIELAVCCVNPQIKKIYDYCVENRKKIFFVSDMYLDKCTIQNILNKNGIHVFENIYISGECGCNKSTGELFTYVLKENNIPRGGLVHLGNSTKADYYMARKVGVSSIKIPTQIINFKRKSHDKMTVNDAFINNHISEGSYYENMGYTQLGPLLVGFNKWLKMNMKKDGMEQVLFLARDGYIIQSVYDILGYDAVVPDYYFEISRRSIRIPSVYTKTLSYEEMVNTLPLISRCDFEQVFDAWGIDIGSYTSVLQELNIDQHQLYWRNEFVQLDSLKQLYERCREDIIENAKREKKALLDYIKKIDWSKKTAIVDIGWGGTIQRDLLSVMADLDIKNDIMGYYIALDGRSSFIRDKDFHARGYLWNNFLKNPMYDEERPYVGLFEILFLEQGGSVKKYDYQNEQPVAVRYEYEYEGFEEQKSIKEVQEGACLYARDLVETGMIEWVEVGQRTMFRELFLTLTQPTANDIKHLSELRFFNNGECSRLASPQNYLQYLKQPQALRSDFFESQWKIGFMKKLFKADLPYLTLYYKLKNWVNR